MPKLPVLPASEVVRGLQRLGYVTIGQRGSHIKLRTGSRTVIVPNHRELRKGTLANILHQAGISIEQLVGAVSQ